MSRVENDNLILTHEESMQLLNSLLMPNGDCLSKRDRFLESIMEMDIVSEENGTILIDIPDLLFENEIIETKKSQEVIKKDEKYCNTAEVVISVCYRRNKYAKIRQNDEKYHSRTSDNNIYYDATISYEAA